MNNIYEEITTNLKASLYERLKDPLLSSFFISWILWNWEPIFILFAYEKTVVDRISYVKEVYFNSGNILFGAYFMPLCVAIFYTFLYPFAKIGIVQFSSWTEKIMRDRKDRYEKEYRLTLEQSKLLKDQLEAEAQQLRIMNDKEPLIQQSLAEELIIHYRKEEEFKESSASIFVCRPQITVGSWVSASGGTAILASHRNQGLDGVVVKVIGQRYCITHPAGILTDILGRNLEANEIYYLDLNNPGNMTTVKPLNTSFILGKALAPHMFEINIKEYVPG